MLEEIHPVADEEALVVNRVVRAFVPLCGGWSLENLAIAAGKADSIDGRKTAPSPVHRSHHVSGASL